MRHAIFRDGPKGVLMCLLVAVGLFVTSCSSDQPKNAATTTTDLGLSPEVAAAHAAIDAFRAAPTSIGTSTPLSKSPRKDIKVAGVACNVPGCILFLDSAKEAAAALGWGYQSFVTTGAPEDLQAQFELAFNSKPDAIISTGFDRTQIGSELDRAKQLGIVVVNAATRDDLQPPYVAINGGTEVFNRNATVLGNFIVADSGGKANVEIFSTKLIPILDVAANTVKTTIEAGCAACKVSMSSFQLTDVGTALPSAVVSSLQSHPDVNYLVFTDGGFATGVPAALAAASMEKRVKIVGVVVGAGNLQDIRDGSEYAWMGYSIAYAAWLNMDALARNFVGDPQIKETQTAAMPTQILTKDSLGDSKTDFTIVGFKESFLKLWGIR